MSVNIICRNLNEMLDDLDIFSLSQNMKEYMCVKKSMFTKTICRHCKNYVRCSLDFFDHIMVEASGSVGEVGKNYRLVCGEMNATLWLNGAVIQGEGPFVIWNAMQVEMGGGHVRSSDAG